MNPKHKSRKLILDELAVKLSTVVMCNTFEEYCQFYTHKKIVQLINCAMVEYDDQQTSIMYDIMTESRG